MTEWPSKEQEIWFQAGVKGERDRIIKMLEENHLTAASELIEQDALIKGEK